MRVDFLGESRFTEDWEQREPSSVTVVLVMKRERRNSDQWS